jgi:hypothetical protein
MIEYKGQQVLISDILHDAADKFLRFDKYDTAPRYRMHYDYHPVTGSGQCTLAETMDEAERFSCCAVDAAIAWHFKLERWSQDAEKLAEKVKKGLREMGCPTGSSSAFAKHGDTWEYNNTEVQGMRYFWLKWAAMMAEEQGV